VLTLQGNSINPLTPLLQQLIEWLHALATQLPLPASISPYAVAIIGIALLVKLVTYPLNVTQMRSMRAMQALQPKLKELQERHGDDRETMAQKQLELYREHQVNPLGGCLPMIIQIPVLFGLYSAINALGNNGRGPLAGERFLWIPDLSKCEPNPLCGAASPPGEVFGLAIPILLILMVVSQMLFQKFMSPPTTDPQAQAMQSVFKWMPLMFAFMFAGLSAGLVLYYTMFNVVAIAQQYAMLRSFGPPGEAAPASDPTGARDARPRKPARAEESNRDGQQRKRNRKK